ncbi:winged helix-turn-helix domain-containing protein [Pseudohalioglobus sediminis]|nr:winged helix-turn-helix domain-containing protein [Pseudohalioglobus sediminis]
MRYLIGDVEFNPAASEIISHGRSTHLQPQVSSVLECLARHHGEVVSREQIFDEAWHGRHAGDECLTRCISLLRQHLHDRDQRHLIETIPRIGYRLTGSVQLCDAPGTPSQVVPFWRRALSGHSLRMLLFAGALLVCLSGWLIAAMIVY